MLWLYIKDYVCTSVFFHQFHKGEKLLLLFILLNNIALQKRISLSLALQKRISLSLQMFGREADVKTTE